MSTGTITYGSTPANGGSYYYNRTWDGANGRWIVTGVKYREAWTKVQVHRSIKRDPISHRKTVVYNCTRIHHPRKVIGHVKKLDMKWNNYTLSEQLITATRRLPNNIANPIQPFTFPLALSANGAVTVQNRLVNAIRGHSFNMAVSGAEMGKTLDMVTHTIVRVSKSIILLKHGRVKDAARALGAQPQNGRRDLRAPTGRVDLDLSNAWLELQYGWKPLLQDVHDAAESLAYHTNPRRSTRISVSITEKKSASISDSTRSGYSEVYVKRRITCELTENLSLARSLGLLNPASVAWEVTPFSFVADWFIPIGTYLDNLSIIPNISGRFLTTDISEQHNTTVGKGSAAGSTVTDYRFGINRTVAGVLTTETPEFKPWAKSISTGHFWNALALLSQLTGKQ